MTLFIMRMDCDEDGIIQTEDCDDNDEALGDILKIVMEMVFYLMRL